MKLTNKYQYQPLTRQSENGVRTYNIPDGTRLPSVTTILSATADKSFIEKWQQSIGKEAADKILQESLDIGTPLHENLEQYILHGSAPKGNLLVKTLTNVVIKNGLSKVDEVWGIESGLYYTGLYAGSTDLVGVHQGEPAIMDFKNSRKHKKEEYLGDYKCQLGAYAMAHDQMYGTTISKGVLMVVCRDGTYQEFVYSGDTFETQCKDQWLTRLSMYYQLHV